MSEVFPCQATEDVASSTVPQASPEDPCGISSLGHLGHDAYYVPQVPKHL